MPASSLIAEETISAVQSCLEGSAAATILGPPVLGRRSAIGVGVRDNRDRPSGPVVRVCAAPLRVRTLDAIADRLTSRFGSDGAVVGLTEIGEREIVEASIPLDRLGPRKAIDLLSAGSTVRAIAKPPAGTPG